MFLTEKEAEDKICPHITYPSMEYLVSTPNPQLVMRPDVCQGSRCMSWRWAGGLPSTEKGYCGLAGRPGIIQNNTE